MQQPRPVPPEAQIETLLLFFDTQVIRWSILYIVLAIISMLIFAFFCVSITLQVHYLIALALGTVIIALILLFSLHALYKESFYSLLSELQQKLKIALHEKERGDRQKIAEELLRIGTAVKKRWQQFIRIENSSYKQIIASPKNFFIREFFWIPYFFFSEALFHSAKSNYISLIRSTPKNLELHTSLANTYVILATHIQEMVSIKEKLFLKGWYLPTGFTNSLKKKIDEASLRAIQELSILRSFQPDELWVLDQLAISYRELEMVEEEIQIYNTILLLYPDDTNALFRLGLLLFKRGENARGLEIYDQLLYLHPILAQEVIRSFGAYDELTFNS